MRIVAVVARSADTDRIDAVVIIRARRGRGIGKDIRRAVDRSDRSEILPIRAALNRVARRALGIVGPDEGYRAGIDRGGGEIRRRGWNSCDGGTDGKRRTAAGADCLDLIVVSRRLLQIRVGEAGLIGQRSAGVGPSVHVGAALNEKAGRANGLIRPVYNHAGGGKPAGDDVGRRCRESRAADRAAGRGRSAGVHRRHRILISRSLGQIEIGIACRGLRAEGSRDAVERAAQTI